MRDEAALTAFYEQLLDAYPKTMQAFAQDKGLSMNQVRMAIRGMIRREQHGDLGATAALDQLEAAMRERDTRGGDDFPMRED